MSDDTKAPEPTPPTTPPPPRTGPTPIGNQNLIIGLILGAGVLLLFILVLNASRGGWKGGGGDTASELKELRTELTERRAFVNDERRRLGLPPLGSETSGQTVEALAARISNDSTDLVTMVRQMQKLLAEKEARLAGVDTTFDALTQQNATLREQLASLQGAQAQAEALQGQLATAQSLYDAAQKRIDDLQTQLATGPSSTMVSELQSQLAAATSQRDQYAAELAPLRSELQALRSENVELRYEVQKIRAELSRTRLFVDKADSLPTAAKALYAQLAKYETISGAELQNEYQKLDTTLRARVVDTIAFETGSARINLDKVEEVRRAVQASGQNSFFLVVGYASKTGNFETNRSLSADRATTIASVVDHHRLDTQAVQAVFLSQTDRFSKNDVMKNQICEVWEIRE